MVALWKRADHYVVVLWFLLSFFFLFSSPNLSGRRLDVYHTSTHGVALVRILEAGLKRAARGSLEMQDAKISPKSRHLRTIVQICRVISSEKNLLSSNISYTRSSSLVTLARRPTWSSLRITDRSFRYASPCLWNQLPSSLRQTQLSTFVSVLPVHAPTTSPHSVNSPLSPSIAPSFFHSRSKTYLFHKFFPP